MDRSQVRAIVEREIDGLMEAFGIPHWKLRISYELRSGNGDARHSGYITRLVDYNKAHIELDPDEFADEGEVLDTLRHELFHVVLAPMDVVLNALHPLVSKDETLRETLECIKIHAIEQTVINLERMYRGLTRKKAPVAKTAGKRRRRK